jgi:protease I
MASRALILLADGFEDSEFLYPFYRFQEANIPVDVAGPARGTCTGKHGYTFDANLSFEQVNHANYTVLIIPGGKASEEIRLQDKAVALTREMVNSGRIVGAVCHGAQLLISAGVLKQRKATCWKGIRDDLIAAGADYLDREVVVDDRLVTSRCPQDLPAFCREILALLEDET